MCWVNTGEYTQAFFYTSDKKMDAWLLLRSRDEFASVPPGDLAELGALHFAGMLPLRPREKSFGLAADEVIQELREKGYYVRRF